MDELNKLVTIRSIQLDQSLEALNFAWKIKMPDSRTPSWIADWHEERLDQRPPLHPCLFKAAADTKPSVRYSTSGNLLVVEGVLIDDIEDLNVNLDAAHWIFAAINVDCSVDVKHAQSRLEALSTLLVQDDNRSSYLPQRLSAVERQRCMRSFCAFLTQLSSSTHFEERTARCDSCMAPLQPPLSHEPDVVYTCPICRQGNFDLCRTCYQDDRYCPHPEHKPLLYQTKFSALEFSADAATVEMVRVISQGETPTFFLRLADRAFNRRTVFRTNTGVYGLCPRTVRGGDTVVVLFGGRTPFILRRIEGPDASRFRLISDCYLEGYMDGEAVRLVNELHRKPQQFVLA